MGVIKRSSPVRGGWAGKSIFFSACRPRRAPCSRPLYFFSPKIYRNSGAGEKLPLSIPPLSFPGGENISFLSRGGNSILVN
jgi:hypothetical protein